MKARTLIRQGTARLKDSPAIDHWQKGREKIESEILLFDLLGEEPDPDDKISPKKQRTFEEWIERRYTGEPQRSRSVGARLLRARLAGFRGRGLRGRLGRLFPGRARHVHESTERHPASMWRS